MDNVSPAERSRQMSLIRSKNTRPERVVRRLLHLAGFRYRLHRPDLPGKPDLVFPARRKVIFVNGCFWHMHPGCAAAHIPRTRAAYWKPKLRLNRRRDLKNIRNLERQGWEAAVVWECEIEEPAQLERRLKVFLRG